MANKVTTEIKTESSQTDSQNKKTSKTPHSHRTYAGVTFMAAILFAASMFGLGFSFGLESSPEPIASSPAVTENNVDPICTLKVFSNEAGESITFDLSSANSDVKLGQLDVYANDQLLEKTGGRYKLQLSGTQEYKLEARNTSAGESKAACEYGPIFVDTTEVQVDPEA